MAMVDYVPPKPSLPTLWNVLLVAALSLIAAGVVGILVRGGALAAAGVGLGCLGLVALALWASRYQRLQQRAWTTQQATLAAALEETRAHHTQAQQQLLALHTAYDELQQRVDERTAERDQSTAQLQLLLDESRSHASHMSALNDVAAALNASLDRNEVLACTLRQLERIVAFDSASVQMLYDDELQVIAARGLPEDVYTLRISVSDNDLARQVIESPHPVIVNDVRTLENFMLANLPIRGWIGAALRVGERTFGLLTVDSYSCDAYSADDARLMANFANQAALALHNAHLYAEAERRAAETGLLLEMTRTLASTLHLPEVLLRAAAAIGEALNADDVAILLLDERGERLIPQAGAASEHGYLRMRWPGPTPLSAEPSLAKVIHQGCARVMHAVSASIPYSTLLALPLQIKDQVLGVVLVATPDDDTIWGPQQLELAEGLATSAAVAMEHARLYDQARRAAQMEERSRLARELHDSVTQTLFSMTLTAEAARAQIDRNPQRAATQIDRLKDAAHQSLGEMRELLLQLRPTPLQEHGLVQSLRDHIATLDAHNASIKLEVHGDDSYAKPHAQGLYRIAQEAVSNALRHAKANQINVALTLDASKVELQIADDGIGFDPTTLRRAGRQLGLTSMAERAAELGASYSIESAPGQGTTLTVTINT